MRVNSFLFDSTPDKMVFERTGSKISTKKSFKSKYLESLPDQQLGNLPHVHIVLHDAKNLVAAGKYFYCHILINYCIDFLGTSDPYVVFTIGKEKVRRYNNYFVFPTYIFLVLQL